MSTASDARLWRDWCAATGHDPTVVTVPVLTAHLTACPTRSRRARRDRTRTIVTLADTDAATRDVLLPTPTPQSAIRDGEPWLTVDDTLSALDPRGWPTGAVARRDAWLILLLGPLGMSRRAALTLTGADVTAPDEGMAGWPTVTGTDLPFRSDPALCGACIAVRWLRVLAADVDAGRRGVETEIAADSAAASGHRCGDGVPRAWPRALTLAPAIDRHGWFGTTLSPRSVTALLAARQRAHTPAPAPTEQPSYPEPPAASSMMGRRPPPDPMIDDALDRLDDALDAVMVEMAAVLDVADGTSPPPR